MEQAKNVCFSSRFISLKACKRTLLNLMELTRCVWCNLQHSNSGFYLLKFSEVYECNVIHLRKSFVFRQCYYAMKSKTKTDVQLLHRILADLKPIWWTYMQNDITLSWQTSTDFHLRRPSNFVPGLFLGFCNLFIIFLRKCAIQNARNETKDTAK